VKLPAVVGDDAACFLAAMLEGVQAERGDCGGIGVPKNTKDPAFLAESVVVVARGSRIAPLHVSFEPKSHGHLPLVACRCPTKVLFR
jgi:hypothetical protein